MPLAAAAGGMLVPALIFVALVSVCGPGGLGRGWAIPCATDIAFSAMVARFIFGWAHPAVPFLLLLAIADDALGLVILAVFYTAAPISLFPLLSLMSVAVLGALWLRRRRMQSFWPYVLGPGVLSWLSLYVGGVHPSLALVPVIPFMPHSGSDLGLFDARESYRHDTLSRFEHWWSTPVQLVLLAFGFVNAGVPFASTGPGTWYVLAALLVGKPVGILGATGLARVLGARLPEGLRLGDLGVVGIAASIGFTVSLFFATAAFAEGPSLAETKMGALLSLVAAPPRDRRRLALEGSSSRPDRPEDDMIAINTGDITWPQRHSGTCEAMATSSATARLDAGVIFPAFRARRTEAAGRSSAAISRRVDVATSTSPG